MSLAFGHMKTCTNTPLCLVDGGIARITLRRPEQRNRLERQDIEELAAALDAIEADEAVRVLVLSAEVNEGRPVFSSGFDIRAFEGKPPKVTLGEVMGKLENLRAVTICALNGSVYGGASCFAPACDMALGVEGMELRVPAAAIGLHYSVDGLQRQIARFGIGFAKRLFLSAEPLNDETLLRTGYVQELLPREKLAERIDQLAGHIANLAPLALASMKRSINEIGRGEIDHQRIDARRQEIRSTEDFQEGLRAFAERRSPRFQGR